MAPDTAKKNDNLPDSTGILTMPARNRLNIIHPAYQTPIQATATTATTESTNLKNKALIKQNFKTK